MARTFAAASSEKVTTSLGGLGVAFGALTIVGIVRITDVTASRRILAIGSATTGTARHGFGHTSTGNLIDFRRGNASANSVAITFSTSDGWCLFAASIAAGTATARFHKYVYSTGTFTHENGSGTIADGTAGATAAYIGATNGGGGSFFNGDIAAVGVWNANLSDAQIESLPFVLSSWFQVSPLGLWMLDQSATGQKIGDLSGGGANESAITGTTVASTSVPVFNYSDGVWLPTIVTAGGGPAVIPLDTAAAVSSATLSLTAETQIPLAASAAQSSATLALKAQTQVPLGTAAASSSATLALTAATQIPLQASVAVSTATATVTATSSAVVPLDPAAGTSTATLALSATTRVPLATSAAQTTATLSLTATTQIPLGASAAQSAATLAVTAGAGVIPLAPSAATSSATLALRAQTQIPLNTAAATSAGTLALTAQTRVLLGTSTAGSSASLTLFTPTTATVVLDTANATSTTSLTLARMGNRWPAHIGDHWSAAPHGTRWNVDPQPTW